MSASSRPSNLSAMLEKFVVFTSKLPNDEKPLDADLISLAETLESHAFDGSLLKGIEIKGHGYKRKRLNLLDAIIVLYESVIQHGKDKEGILKEAVRQIKLDREIVQQTKSVPIQVIRPHTSQYGRYLEVPQEREREQPVEEEESPVQKKSRPVIPLLKLPSPLQSAGHFKPRRRLPAEESKLPAPVVGEKFSF